MYFRLALLASFGVAVCNGIAAVLEKVSADKEQRVTKIRFGFIFRLIKDWPYAIGVALDGAAWILTLVAVHALPLFVVQPIIAFSVVVTVLVDYFFMHRQLKWPVFLSIGIIFIGLALIALTATPERAQQVDNTFKWAVFLTPVVLAAAASYLIKVNSKTAGIGLGVISGIAFGGTAITGRMLIFTPPYWHVLINPTLWALVAYGIVGIIAFTVALQSHNASIINATSVTFDTILPLLIGIYFLGDKPRSNHWLQLSAGITMALLGAIIISLSQDGDQP